MSVIVWLFEHSLALPFKEIKPVNPKGNQSWIYIGRTDAEAETTITFLLDANNWLFGKDPDAGKDWRQEKWTTEDEMVGWHHWLNGHEFEQALGDGEGQGNLAYCSPWGCKELAFPNRWPNIGVSASDLLMNIQDWFPLGLTALISLHINMIFCHIKRFKKYFNSIRNLSVFILLWVSVSLYLFS